MERRHDRNCRWNSPACRCLPKGSSGWRLRCVESGGSRCPQTHRTPEHSGENEGSRLNGTRQVSPLRHPNFIERLLRNQGLGQVGVGIGPTRAVCNACRVFVHIEDTRAVGFEDMAHRIRPQGSDREDGRREYISGLARSDGACPTGIQKAAERTVCVGDKRWSSVRECQTHAAKPIPKSLRTIPETRKLDSRLVPESSSLN